MPAPKSKNVKVAKVAKPAPAPATTKKRVNFVLTAPQAQQVCVAGTFNDWDRTAKPLRADKDGVWRAWLNLAPGEYEYLFVVDGDWSEDPACPDRRTNPFGSDNCILRV